MPDAFGGIMSGIGNAAGAGLSGLESLGGSAMHGVEGLFGGGASAPMTPQASAITSAPLPPIAPPSASTGVSGLGAPADLAASLPNATTGIDASLPDSVTSALNGSAGAGAGGSQAAGSGGFLNKLLSDPKSLASMGLLGYSLLNANKTPPEVQSLKNLAGQEGAIATEEGKIGQGGQMGLLGASGDAMLNQQLQSQQAAIRSRYAAMGMSGSSAEQADLAGAAQSSLAERFALGQNVAQTGLTAAQQATGVQSQLLQQIMQQETAQGSELGDILAQFAGLAVKPQTTTAA